MKIKFARVTFLTALFFNIFSHAQDFYAVRLAITTYNKENPGIAIKSESDYEAKRSRLGRDMPAYADVAHALAKEGKPATWIFGYSEAERTELRLHLIDLLIEIRHRAISWNKNASMTTLFKTYAENARYLGENMPPAIVYERAMRGFNLEQKWTTETVYLIEPEKQLLNRPLTGSDAFLDPLYDYVSLAVTEQRVDSGLALNDPLSRVSWDSQFDTSVNLPYEERWKIASTLLECRKLGIKSPESYKAHEKTSGLEPYDDFVSLLLRDRRIQVPLAEIDWLLDDSYVRKVLGKIIVTIRREKIYTYEGYEARYKALGLPNIARLIQYLKRDGQYLKRDKSGIDWVFVFTGRRPISPGVRLSKIQRAVLSLDIETQEQYKKIAKTNPDFVSINTLKDLILEDPTHKFVKSDGTIDWDRFFGVPDKAWKGTLAAIGNIRAHKITSSTMHDVASTNLTNIMNRSTLRDLLLKYDVGKKYILANGEVNWPKIYFGDHYVTPEDSRILDLKEILRIARDEFEVKSIEQYREASEVDPRFPDVNLLTKKVKDSGNYPKKPDGKINWKEVFASGGTYLGVGLPGLFAKDGVVERVVNEVAAMLVDPEVRVALEEVGPQNQAKLKQLPSVLQDRIYRFYNKTREIFPELGVDATFALAVNLASTSLGEAASENYEENIKTFERYYVAEFERMLELRQTPTAVMKEQIRLLAGMYAIAVGKYVNAGYSVPEAMVHAFESIKTPSGLAGLTGFAVTAKIVSDIGSMDVLRRIRGKKISVVQAQRLLKVVSFTASALGIVAQESLDNYFKIVEANRTENVAYNAGYVLADQSGLGTLAPLDYFQAPIFPDAGELYKVYDQLGLKITTDRSVLAQMGELERLLVMRPIYRTEAMVKPNAATFIAQKMALKSAGMMKNSMVALSRLDAIDVLVHTGILTVSNLFGSAVPGVGIIPTLIIAGALSEQYENIRHGINDAADLSDYEDEIASLMSRDQSNAYRMREAAHQLGAGRLTPEWVQANLEKRIETMNFNRVAWREEIRKQESAVLSAYQAVFRTTIEFMRSRKVTEARDIARQTILGLKAYGAGQMPEHPIDPIHNALSRMHYSHLALERLMDVPWMSSLKGAGCRSTIGCLEFILLKDEHMMSASSTRKEAEASAMARIPLQLVLQDELLASAKALNVRDNMQKFRQAQAKIEAVEPMVEALYETMMGINDRKIVAPKPSQPIASMQNGHIEIVGLSKGTYAVHIVASLSGGQNIGGKSKTKRAKVGVLDVENSKIHSVVLSDKVRTFCSQKICYLEVVDMSKDEVVGSLNIRL